MPQLLIQDFNGGPKEHVFDLDSIGIGRFLDNDVVLNHDSVSGHHAEIAKENGKFVLRDLGSSNGTKLNGQPIRERVLADGDAIQFGPVEAKFIQGTPGPIQLPKSAYRETAAAAPLPENVTGSAVKHEVKNLKSISSSLRHTAAKVMSGVSVAARLAALKAKIEKLKLVDLNKAHYALGKKYYELGLFREQFKRQFDEIAKLNQTIEESRNGTTPAQGQSTSEAFKTGAIKIAMRVKAEGMTLKLQPLFVAVGREIEESKLLNSQIDINLLALKVVTNSIHSYENQVDAIRRGTSFLTDSRKNPQPIAATGAEDASRVSGGATAAIRRHWKLCLTSIVVALVCLFLALLFYWTHSRHETRLAIAPSTRTENQMPPTADLTSVGSPHGAVLPPDLSHAPSTPAIPKTSKPVANDSRVEAAVSAITELTQGCLFNGRSDPAVVSFNRSSGEMSIQCWQVGMGVPPSKISFYVGDIDSSRTVVKSWDSQRALVLHTKGDVESVRLAIESAFISPSTHKTDYTFTGNIEEHSEVGIWFNSIADAKEATRAFEFLAHRYLQVNKSKDLSAVQPMQKVRILLSKLAPCAVEIKNGEVSIELKDGTVGWFNGTSRLGIFYHVAIGDLDPSRFTWEKAGEEPSHIKLECKLGRALAYVNDTPTATLTLTAANERDAKIICEAIEAVCSANGWHREF